MTLPVAFSNKWSKWAITVGLPAILFFIPASETFTPQLRMFFAITSFFIIFVCFGFTNVLLPSLLVSALYIISGLAPAKVALSSWTNLTVYMVIGAFAIANALEECGLLMVTFGAYGHDTLANIDPSIVDEVAVKFPRMPIIVGHAGWPNVGQMCWLAFKRPNVYLSPDYMAGYAGGSEYIRAACTMLENKVMFGSAYPILSQQHAIGMYQSLAEQTGMKKNVLDKVLGLNAARLFGLV